MAKGNNGNGNGNGGGGGGNGGGGGGGGGNPAPVANNANANKNNNGGGGQGGGGGGGGGGQGNNNNQNNNGGGGQGGGQSNKNNNNGGGSGGSSAGNGIHQNVAGLGGSTAAPVHNGGGGSQAPASAGPDRPKNSNPNGNGGSSAKEGGTGPLHSNAPVGGNGPGGINAGSGNKQGQGNGPGGIGAGGGNGGGGNNPSWTNDYQQWLKDHPHPGNNPNAGSVNAPDGVKKWNADYHAWLKDHPHPGSVGNNQNGPGIGPGGVAGGNGPDGVNIGVPPYATGGYPASEDVPTEGSTDGGTEVPYPGSASGEGLDGLNAPGGLGIPGVSDQPIGSMLEQANQQPGQTIAPTEGGGFQIPDILGQLPIQPGMLSHIVNPGDTMSGIAQQSGLSLDDIKALNPQIPNPNMIFPGQSVNLGTSGADASAQAAGGIAPPDASASGFPTSSSYPPSEEDEARRESVGRIRGFGKRLRGWGSGGNVASDPARNAMYIGSERNTNPLDIKDGRNPGQGQDTSNPG